MSYEHFDEECPGCRPAMVDVKTMQPFADDSPEMKTVRRLWGETSREERLAWHRFTCQNSRSLMDVQLVKTFSDRLEAALGASTKREG